jgi:hypothetical protein
LLCRPGGEDGERGEFTGTRTDGAHMDEDEENEGCEAGRGVSWIGAGAAVGERTDERTEPKPMQSSPRSLTLYMAIVDGCA